MRSPWRLGRLAMTATWAIDMTPYLRNRPLSVGGLVIFFRQQLEGHLAFQAVVVGQVDDAHATLTQLFFDLVMKKTLADHVSRLGAWLRSLTKVGIGYIPEGGE